MGDIVQLRQPTWAVTVGISDCCVSRRILRTARTVHEASDAISLVSSPSVSNVLIRIHCVESSCGAMIVADTKALTLGRDGR
jgi:hypothetical protein